MNKTILVTGGTGFLGLHTCEYFYNLGYDIIAFDITPFKKSDNIPEDVKYFEGDVRDSEAIVSCINEHEPDYVVHAAAALPLWNAGKIRDVNKNGTETVLKECSDSDCVSRFTYISSTAVYGTHDEHPIVEDSNLDGVGPYGESKIAAEEICREYRDKSLEVAILRPKTFIGPKRLGVFEVLFDWVEDGASVPLIGWGKNKYQLLHVEDLVESMNVLFDETSDSFNQTYNVGAREYDTMREDFQSLLDYEDRGGKIVGTPSFLSKNSLKILNYLNLSPLYPWVYETAHED